MVMFFAAQNNLFLLTEMYTNFRTNFSEHVSYLFKPGADASLFSVATLEVHSNVFPNFTCL